MREIAEVLSLAMCLFAAWVAATPSIRTGWCCTVGFGMQAVGFFGVFAILHEDTEIYLFRAVMVLIAGYALCVFGVGLRWWKTGWFPHRFNDWVEKRGHGGAWR